MLNISRDGAGPARWPSDVITGRQAQRARLCHSLNIPLAQDPTWPAIRSVRCLPARRASSGLSRDCLEAFRQHPDYTVITSFPGRADLSAPASWPRAAMTAPGSPTPPRGQGLCWVRPRYQGIQALHIRHLPQGQEQPARRRRLHLGLRLVQAITGSPRPLRPGVRPVRSLAAERK
jgi:hypothetical protein